MEEGPVRTSTEPSIVRPTRPGSRERQTRMMREIIETVLLTALVYFVVRASVQFTPIDGPSMQPGLHTGESVVVNELAYLFGNPQRGDVIVLHPPSSPDQQYIKRIIAVPGDTIQITDTAVIVDGVTLNEPYLNPTGDSTNVAGDLPPTTLAAGDYFVMGDNRNNSTDSRFFGPVERQAIVGQADLVIWPLGEIHPLATYHGVFANVKP
jgi:signal peptidase I